MSLWTEQWRESKATHLNGCVEQAASDAFPSVLLCDHEVADESMVLIQHTGAAEP